MKRLYLSAKPSHMGVDVDGLAYSLHWPTAQLPDEGTRPSARRCLVLSLQWTVAPFGGCEAPGV
jgi:hypothetical protein